MNAIFDRTQNVEKFLKISEENDADKWLGVIKKRSIRKLRQSKLIPNGLGNIYYFKHYPK